MKTIEYLEWRIDSKDIPQEFRQAVAAFERRTGRSATVLLVREMTAVPAPAGVQLHESIQVPAGTLWATDKQ